MTSMLLPASFRGGVASACLLAGAALVTSPALAQHVTVVWDSGRFSHEATVAAGKVLEVCEPLARDARVGWAYEAASPLDFNVHIHVGSTVAYPERRDATAVAEGTLVAAEAQHYCWMWTNRSAAPVALKLRLTKP